MELHDFLSRLRNVKHCGGYYMACCPAHDDHKRSLSINTGQNNQILVHCHAGCQTENIVQHMGLSMSDLFADRKTERKPEKKRIVQVYPYKDCAGEVICEKLRYSDKTFSWRQPNHHGGWIYNRKGLSQLPLYRQECIRGNTVYVVEGEKDVDTMMSGHLCAVCSPDGAGRDKWKPYMSEVLRGLHVRVLQDNDEIGKEFAKDICQSLSETAASVRLIDLTDLWPEMPDKADVSDYVAHCEAAGMDKETVFRDLESYSASAAEYASNEEKSILSKYPIQRISEIDFSLTPKVHFYVQDVLTEGVSFLTAFSKVGKSRLIMQMLLSICSGAPFLGKKTSRSSVLYCAFEDERIDFENRLKLFLKGGEQPDNFFYYTKESFNYHVPTLGDDAMLIPLLESILQEHPDIRVIAIDVFGVIRSKKKSGIDFTSHERLDVDQLLRLAAKYKAAVIVAHHVSKTGLRIDRQNSTGSGAGSYVISGTVHAELEIALDHEDQNRAKFSYKGRRIRSGSLAIRDEYPFWILEGNWEMIRFADDPVVKMIEWLVSKYGSWRGSSKEFLNENLRSGQPYISGKPNRNTFQELSTNLLTLGIQYIPHSNGSGGAIHEFCRLDNSEIFTEIPDVGEWDEICLRS